VSETPHPEVLMHLDGCHFFVWVSREPSGNVELSYDERTGDNLALHASDDPCGRCSALRRGDKPRHHVRRIDPWPDDSREQFAAVLAKVGELA